MTSGRVLAFGLAGCALAGGAPTVLAAARPAAVSACAPALSFGVLPAWARGGFSSPEPRMPHALGRRGQIVAVVFGYPLLSPPSGVRANKILWVTRTPPIGRSNLRITAQRMTGDRDIGSPVQRTVDYGPGPSIVDLPAAGCWRLTLRWSGKVESMDLRYRAKP